MAKDPRYVLADCLVQLAINGQSAELFGFADLPSKEVLVQSSVQLDRLTRLALAVRTVLESPYPPSEKLKKIQEALQEAERSFEDEDVIRRIRAVQQGKHPAS